MDLFFSANCAVMWPLLLIMQLVYIYHCLTLVTVIFFPVTNVDDLLNGESNNVIVSSSRDTTLKVHNAEETKTLRIYSKPVNCVRYV